MMVTAIIITALLIISFMISLSLVQVAGDADRAMDEFLLREELGYGNCTEEIRKAS